MEYTLHKLEIQSTDELQAGEVLPVEPEQFLQMLGELGTRATIDYDDARQHLVFAEFPLKPVEVQDEREAKE